MKINLYNEGDNPIRVIIDGDTVNDSTLEPGEERFIESRDAGVIELRELDEPQAATDQSD
jgi:hypothetical protein